MTTPQFIAWLDDKMAAFGNGKLVPPATVLTEDLSDMLEHRLHRQITEQILREARIEERVRRRCGEIALPVARGPACGGAASALAGEPAASWRAAVERVADRLLAAQASADAPPESGHDRARWDQQAVARRLEEAADVLARLPEERVRGFYDLWPRIVGSPASGARPAAAAPEAIDRMDEALGWLLLARPGGAPAGLAAGRGHALEADHPPAWDRPHHGVAALDDGAAQDRDPAERGR